MRLFISLHLLGFQKRFLSPEMPVFLVRFSLPRYMAVYIHRDMYRRYVDPVHNIHIYRPYITKNVCR